MTEYQDDHWSVEISLFTFDGLGNNIVGYMERVSVPPKFSSVGEYLLDFWTDHLWNKLPDGHRADIEVRVRDSYEEISIILCLSGSAMEIWNNIMSMQA